MSESPRDGRSRPNARDAGRRWIEVLPTAVVVAAGVAVVVLRPAVLRGTLGSPRALLVVAGVTVTVVGWSALLRRGGASATVRSVLVLAPIVLAGFVWIRPYFTDTRVDEAIPLAAVDAATATPQAAGPSAPLATERARRPRAERTEPVRSSAGSASPTPAEPAPNKPVALTRGEFVGLDGHRATGTAAVLRLPGGALLVRLEDVDLQSVPDAYVYLVPRADARSPVDGSLNLGPLAGNVGSSNYPLPSDADGIPAKPWTVLVWCRPFASPVGAAPQTPAG